MPSETPESTRIDEGPADPLLDRSAGFEALAALLEKLPCRPGTVVKGRVAAIEAAGARVTIEGGEGRVPAAELGAAPPAVGDEIDVYVVAVTEEGPLLSRDRAERLALFDRLQLAAERDEPVRGRVLARVSGGLSVDVGMKALLPDRRPRAPLGEAGDFWVRGFDERKEMFLLAREGRSARDARKAAKEAGGEATAAGPITLPAVGDVVTGKVARLAEFGAFVDLPGGATGLLHVKEMGHGRGGDPASMMSVGEEVTVKVVKVQAGGEDGRSAKVSLSRRALEPDPWSTVDGRLVPGQRVTGKVVGFAEYGAFVEVEPGVEGLVHVTEMTWAPSPGNPKDLVQAGASIDAEILAVDAAKKHLKLSMKRLQPSPFAILRERFPIGTQVRGPIKSVTSFGLFVTLDPEHRLEGLVHVSDVSWEPVARLSDVYRPGQEVEVLVLGFDDERGRCSLGMRQLVARPEQPALEAFSPGQVLEGQVTRLKDFGAFVAIAPGIEGLLHVSEMRAPEGTRPRQLYKSGQAVQVRVLTVDLDTRRIGLGLASPEAPAASDAPPETPPVSQD